MANRHLARNVVLQSLFEWDFRGLPDKKISEIVERNAKEFGSSGDVAFMQELAKSVLAKREEIDNIIEKAAPDCRDELHAYWDGLPGPGNDLAAALRLGAALNKHLRHLACLRFQETLDDGRLGFKERLLLLIFLFKRFSGSQIRHASYFP